MSKVILFVDEEKWFVDPIIDRVESALTDARVEFVDDGAAALDRCDNQPNVTHVVLDLLLPIFDISLNEEFTQSTHYPDNVHAGLFILDRLKNMHPEIQVLCMTMVPDEDTIDYIENKKAKYLYKLSGNLTDKVINFITN